jgi:hypothetical protein
MGDREFSHAFLSQDSFGTYNKKLAKIWNIHTAVLLADLSNTDGFFEEKGKLTKDGFFWSTTEDIFERTTLTRAMQENALKILVSAGIVKTILQGVPPKKHFQINYDNLYKIMSSEEGDEYECE